MTRKLMLLNGLAILAVVLNHSALAGLTAMFWWTDRYRPGVAIPNWDQFGSVSHYTLIAMMKLSFFAVPSFLFVSGSFLAYTVRGNTSALNWKMVRTRVVALLIPYLIWSGVQFVAEILLTCHRTGCTIASPLLYLKRLLIGDTYWYVPLICQVFLLSPILVPWAKNRWRPLLSVAILAQLSSITISYMSNFSVPVPKILVVAFTGPFFLRDILYSVSGIIVGFHLTEFKNWLARIKWWLPGSVVIFAVLTLVESEVLYRLVYTTYSENGHIQSGYHTIPMTLYIFSFVLCFLAFDIPAGLSKLLYQLGRNSYGIYMLQGVFIVFVFTKIIYHVAPPLLGYQIIYVLILVALVLSTSLWLINFIANSRLKGMCRYLFG